MHASPFQACLTCLQLVQLFGEFMMFPEFVVPLTPQDLPADETYEQINASLSALQQASDGVFARIQNAVEDSRGM